MDPKAPNFHRLDLESDYEDWATICETKHGKPRMFSADELKSLSDSDLAKEVKKLKDLGRTPRE